MQDVHENLPERILEDLPRDLRAAHDRLSQGQRWLLRKLRAAGELGLRLYDDTRSREATDALELEALGLTKVVGDRYAATLKGEHLVALWDHPVIRKGENLVPAFLF